MGPGNRRPVERYTIDQVDRPAGDWWIDDAGYWRLVDPVDSRLPSWSAIGGDIEEESIAFRQLGMVQVYMSARKVRVRWDLRHVHPGSMESVLEELDRDSPHRRISLCFYYGGWNTETFDAAGPARRRIEQMQAYRSVELSDLFYIQRQDISAITDSDDLLRRGYHAWERADGRIGRNPGQGLSCVLPYVLTIRPRDTDGRLYYAGIGGKAALRRFMGDDWALGARQQRFTGSVTDTYYDSRGTEGYAEVLRTRQPRLDHVRASIHRAGREATWASYQRLLLPAWRVGGAPLLLCLSQMTSDINIPFLADSA